MPIAESLPPQRRRQIGLSMPATLAKIHAVDLEKSGLDDLASHKPYAQRQLKRWAGQWEQSKLRELPDLDDLTRRLIAAAPQQQELTLVHGDFHLRNLITSRTTGDVIGVLDWELSTLGDPLADMGSLLAYPRREDMHRGLRRLRAGRVPGPGRDGAGISGRHRARRGDAEVLARVGPVEDRHHR